MDRGIELLKATAKWLGQKDFMELTATVYYDGAECDGNCLLEDIKAYLEEVVPNSNIKPDCKLIGEDGNVFNLIGIASRTLEKHGVSWKADEMRKRIYDCDSYDEALRIIGEYVNII